MTSQHKIKAVFFDFMGTCLDWHSSVLEHSPSAIPKNVISQLALDWRVQYFLSNSKRLEQNLPPEDIDDTLARTLNHVVETIPEFKSHFDDAAKTRMVEAWHKQRAWPEVAKAIRGLREDLSLEVFVHANGTTRLQLDLTRSSGLSFNMLFSSQLLGIYKPDLRAYQRGLELVKLKPEEVVLVAAHAYDLRGAQKAGMKTIYIHRWTDDVDEDMEKVKKEFDVFLEDMNDLPAVVAKMQGQ